MGIILQSILLSLLKNFVDEPYHFLSKSMIFGILSLLIIAGILIFCIVKAIKEYRKINPEYTYRKLVAQGLIVTLIIAVLFSVISYTYNNYINTGSKEQTIELTKRMYENMDVPDEVREEVNAKLENPTPVRDQITSMGLLLVLGMIISLISAMLMNRRNMMPTNQLR